MSRKADVLIVTLTKVESRAVLDAFQQASGHKAQPQSIDDRTYFDFGTINSARVWMTQSEMGSGGPAASLLTVRKGIQSLSPVAIIMVGIAFGINNQKQAIGDILVTENLRPYELQRVGTRKRKPEIILRGDRPHASPWLINHMKSADGHKAHNKRARQKTAEQNAAAFVLHALQFALIDWKNKRCSTAQPAGALSNIGTGAIAAHGSVAAGERGVAVSGNVRDIIIGPPQAASRPTPSVYSSLPEPPADFAGRQEQIESHQAVERPSGPCGSALRRGTPCGCPHRDRFPE